MNILLNNEKEQEKSKSSMLVVVNKFIRMNSE